MAGTESLTLLLRAIANSDDKAAADMLDTTPSLATVGLAQHDGFFLAERFTQVYEGDTALHAAGFSYNTEMAQDLITRGADIRASNRRGAEPLHAAVIGSPGSTTCGTQRANALSFSISSRRERIPTQPPPGALTPLHRAVRNRCSAAVEALLGAGADPHLQNNSGSTASDLARWTTGRGGTGSEAAGAEQRIIL